MVIVERVLYVCYVFLFLLKLSKIEVHVYKQQILICKLSNSVSVGQLLALGNVCIFCVKCISATPVTIQLEEFSHLFV